MKARKESAFYIILDTALIITTDAIMSKLSQLMKALMMILNTFCPRKQTHQPSDNLHFLF